MRGFSEMELLDPLFSSGGSMAIKFNEDVYDYFETKKGLLQGDPLSPILFSIVADLLAFNIEHGKYNGQIGSVVPHRLNGGLSIPWYLDAPYET
jgi:hypothetical protein